MDPINRSRASLPAGHAPPMAAEEALRRAQEKYRLVIDNALEGIVIAEEGIVRFVNPRFLQMLGLDRSQLIGTDILDIVHPEDRSTIVERRERRRRGEPVPVDDCFRVIRSDGAVRWIEYSGLIIDWDGVPATLSFVIDVTERRLAEEGLRRSETAYRLLIESSPIGVGIFRRGRVLLANATMCRRLGYTEAELLAGDDFLVHVHEDDVAFAREHTRQVAQAAPGASFTASFRMVTSTGQTLWVEVNSVRIDWQGAPATLSFVHDVTERVQLDADLKKTLAERETVLERSIVGTAFLEPNGRLRWANSALVQLFGTTLEAMKGVSLERYYESRESYLATGAAVSAAVLAGRAYESELRMRRLDGTLFWVHVSGRAVQPTDLSQGTVWVAMDIERRKKAESEVHAALEKQRELNYLKSRFVSMASHEFRTPLATIQSSAELLRDYAPRLPEEEKAALLRGIQASVQRMTKMLEDVLLIGQVEADRLKFEPRPLELQAFCAGLAQEVAQAEQADGRRADRIRLEVQGDEAVVNLDEDLMRQILGNLLSNALKYSPETRPVELLVQVGEAGTRFTVRDGGIGIPSEELPHLFGTFHRGRNVGNVQGTGLGLAIVKKAVDLHGGRIEVSTQLNRGTSFVVSLPR